MHAQEPSPKHWTPSAAFWLWALRLAPVPNELGRGGSETLCLRVACPSRCGGVLSSSRHDFDVIERRRFARVRRPLDFKDVARRKSDPAQSGACGGVAVRFDVRQIAIGSP